MISNKSVLAILANCGTVADVDSYITETETFLNEIKTIKAELAAKDSQKNEIAFDAIVGTFSSSLKPRTLHDKIDITSVAFRLDMTSESRRSENLTFTAIQDIDDNGRTTVIYILKPDGNVIDDEYPIIPFLKFEPDGRFFIYNNNQQHYLGYIGTGRHTSTGKQDLVYATDTFMPDIDMTKVSRVYSEDPKPESFYKVEQEFVKQIFTNIDKWKTPVKEIVLEMFEQFTKG